MKNLPVKLGILGVLTYLIGMLVGFQWGIKYMEGELVSEGRHEWAVNPKTGVKFVRIKQ